LEATCEHTYCHKCANKFVKIYVREESLHPLRCCDAPIPDSRVEGFLGTSRKVTLYRQKHQEYSTPPDKRIYCPEPRCSRFLRCVADTNDPEKPAQCPSCCSLVCLQCKGFSHPGAHCEVSGDNVIRKLAKDQGWQTCPRCKRIVERISGCSVMICCCGRRFCYICG
ncbi:hypothetical protein P691DRAFT_611494, partial [Macrolepiota fuliginosa MF-IS2]